METKETHKTQRLYWLAKRAALGLGLSLGLASTVQAQPECSATLVNQWYGIVSQINARITNPTAEPIAHWRMEVTYPLTGYVANVWSATKTGTNPATFEPLATSAAIKAGSSKTFGFKAIHMGGLEQPQITACYDADKLLIVDDDQDGIADTQDLCPNTTDAPVDANGCSQGQRDDDTDGVPNGVDGCPAR